MFQARREVPAAWQQALEAMVPKSDRVPWLQLVWYPGLDYEPVQRWVIYEMVPDLSTVHPDMLADLRGKNPRTHGTWVEDRRLPWPHKRWNSDSLHSLTQWELFRATNCYPLLFWIIQGDKGGHPWRLNTIERAFEVAIEGIDLPDPGDLPYAEWDQRVADKIMEFDRLRRWTRDWESRSVNKTEAGLLVARESYDMEQQFETRVRAWLDDIVEQAVSDVPRRLLPSWSDLPRGDTHYNASEEADAEATLAGLSHARPGEE